MANRAEKKTAEVGYLLGTLSEQEAARLEDAFFADDAKFEELEVAEDDLIDAYVRNELSPTEREKFRERLMPSPRIVERVNFARALAEKTSLPLPPARETERTDLSSEEQQKLKPRWWESLFGSRLQLQPALAVCIVFVGGALLLTSWLRLRAQSSQLAAERAAVQRQKEELDKRSAEQQATASQLTAELQQQLNQVAADRKLLEDRLRNEERSPSTLGSIFSAFLMPGASRSPGAFRDLKFGSDTSTAQLKLVLATADYRSYGVTVTTADGVVVLTKMGLQPRKTTGGSIVEISVLTRQLPPGDYNARVFGVTPTGQVEDVDDYSFRVLKKSK